MVLQAQEVRRKAQLANEATRGANLVLKALKAQEKERERLADQARAGESLIPGEPRLDALAAARSFEH